jgi:hypothetical protein
MLLQLRFEIVQEVGDRTGRDEVVSHGREGTLIVQ